jgi:hypothetical protein
MFHSECAPLRDPISADREKQIEAGIDEFRPQLVTYANRRGTRITSGSIA